MEHGLPRRLRHSFKAGEFMSKNKNSKHSAAEDYLAQVDWQNQQAQRKVRVPSRFEPAWKHKSVGPRARQGDATVISTLILFLIPASGFLYSIITRQSTEMILGFGVALTLLGMFYLMVRDASKK
jgi:hypothetical protein